MNKKIIIGAVVLLIVAILVILLFVYRGAISEEEVQTEEEETSLEFIGAEEDEIFETEEFNILLPKDWSGYQETGDVFTAFLVTGTEEEMDQETIWTQLMVEKFPREDMTLDDHMDEIMGFLEEEISYLGEDSIIVSEEQEMTVSDYPAKYLEVAFDMEGYQATTAAVFIESEEVIWSVAINLPTADWPNYQELFDQVIDSFEIK